MKKEYIWEIEEDQARTGRQDTRTLEQGHERKHWVGIKHKILRRVRGKGLVEREEQDRRGVELN